MIKNTPVAWDERAKEETSWDAAMWSERSQRKRFELVVEWLLPLIQPGDRLLDFGCGTGALAELLAPYGLELFAWDWSTAMRLRATRDHPNLTVLERDPIGGPELFDHVVAIGPFNLAHNWSKQDTRDTIVRLWSLSRRSVTVSLYRGMLTSGMLRYEHDDLVRLHERLGYPTMRLSNEHLPNDWMVRFSRSHG